MIGSSPLRLPFLPDGAGRPALAGTVLRLEKDGAYCFLRPEVPDWLVCNQNAAAILSRCDGSLPAEEIAACVSRQHGALAPGDVLAFLAKVRAEHRLFADQPALAAPHQPHRLRSVHLSLTPSCNLACAYCYATARAEPARRMAFGDYEQLLERLANLAGPLEIVLTGGEPTLNSHWLDIARRARALGHSPQLLTNATRISPDDAGQMSGLFDLIKVSIDGSGEVIHDAQRGAGTFALAMRGVEAMLNAGARVSLSMTVTRQNIRDVEAAATRFGPLLTFAPLFKAGRGKARVDLDITGAEYFEALASAKGVTPLNGLCDTFASAPHRPVRKCAIGDAELSVGPDGEAYPCHLLHEPCFRGGNVFDDPLGAILDAPAMAGCSELLVESMEGCRDCPVRYLCGGGCRARVYHATGSLSGPDGFCVYEQRAYLEGLFAAHPLGPK